MGVSGVDHHLVTASLRVIQSGKVTKKETAMSYNLILEGTYYHTAKSGAVWEEECTGCK